MALVKHKLFPYYIIAALLVLVTAGSFARPVALGNVVNPTFGTVVGGPSGQNFILNTDGTISGTNAADYLSGAVAGSLTISGTNGAAIDILATNLSSNGGVNIVNVTCNFNNTGDQDCDLGFSAVASLGRGNDMSIGLEINTTQVHGDATAAPTFDIVVNYI